MGRVTRDELRKKRAAGKADRAEGVDQPDEIVVGMATCGIAAGARKTADAFRDELKKNHLDQVRVRPSGCLGQCHAEPTVEVRVHGMPPVVYGKVDPDTARRIVRKHVIGKLLINDHIYDRPAADMVVGASAGKE